MNEYRCQNTKIKQSKNNKPYHIVNCKKVAYFINTKDSCFIKVINGP